jgi:hypothetical protein
MKVKENRMKVGEAIIEAAKKQAEGEMAVHKANIEVYKTMPAGIGEHSDVTEAVIAELDKMAAASDRLEMIEKHFSKKMSDDIFDFGFTVVDESELEAVKKTQDTANDAEQLATTTQDKLDKLYNAITPLLNNLKKNPEKEYILWPNRVDKVEQFEDMLRKIYQA